MKRQNTRKTVGLASLLLFPITLPFLSPYIIIVASSIGLLAGSGLLFIALFLLSLAFGRLFCGWLCPMGGLQECFLAATGGKAMNTKSSLIKYGLWGAWMVAIILLLARAGGINAIDPLFMTNHGFFMTEVTGYVIYYGVIVIGFGMALVWGSRAFCHMICWISPFMIVGGKIACLFRWPSLHLRSDAADCTACKACTRKCPMGLEVHLLVKKGDCRHSECILCGECADACPKKVLRYAMRHDSKRWVKSGTRD